MKLLKNSDCLFFTLILLLQYFLPSTFIFIIGIIYFAFTLLKNKFPRIRLTISFALLLFLAGFASLIGLTNLFGGGTVTRDYVRDLFYYLSPLLFLMVGQVISIRYNNNLENVLESVCFAGTLLSVYFIFNALLHIPVLLNGSVQSWRSTIGNGYLESAVAIVFSVYLFKNGFFSKKKCIIFVSLNIIEILLTLSRSNIIVLMIFAFVFSLKRIRVDLVFTKIFKYGMLILIFLFVLSLFPAEGIFGQFFVKIMNSTNEISVRTNWGNYDSIVNNWRGYETYCAIEQWGNYDFVSQLFGKGFGERIYVGDVGVLVYKSLSGESAEYIPVLHNGYSTLLIKNGILGLAIYVLFVFFLFYKGVSISKKKKLEAKVLIAASITVFVLTFIICGLFKDNNLMVLMVITGFSISKQNSYLNKNYCEIPNKCGSFH